MASIGDIVYRGSSVWKRLVGNTSSTKKFLRQTGSAGVATAPAWDTIALDDVSNVNAPSPSDGDVLTYDSGGSEWVNAAPTGGGDLDDLSDVNVPTPSDGDHLAFDSGSGEWVNVAPTSGGSGSSTGAAASIPSPSTDGLLYLPNNGFYVYRDTGAAWVPWGPLFPMTNPALAAPTTWVNQGSAAVVTTNGGISLSVAANASASLRLRVKTAPSTPYTITAAFLLNALGNHGSGGPIFRQSSDGKLVQIGKGGGNTNLQVNNWTSATVFSATPVDITAGTATFGRLQWYRWTDNGTNRIISVSADGVTFVQIYSVARTTFLTADQVGFYVVDNATYDVGVTLLSWKET